MMVMNLIQQVQNASIQNKLTTNDGDGGDGRSHIKRRLVIWFGKKGKTELLRQRKC